jgi:hypothetical protein
VKIEHYSFGRITIQGKTYTFDVIIFPETVAPSWLRKEGHFLHMDDLKSVVHARPEVIVIGTGYYGRMQITNDVLVNLGTHGMDVRIAKTPEAVDLFNEISSRKKTVACLHLTC